MTRSGSSALIFSTSTSRSGPMRGRALTTSGGWSECSSTPTSQSPRPRAQTISVLEQVWATRRITVTGARLPSVQVRVAESIDDTQTLANPGKRVNRLLQMFARVGSGNLGANACLALWNHRIEKADDVNAFVQQLVGHLLGQRGVVQHDGHNGMLARQNLKSGIGHEIGRASCRERAKNRGVSGETITEER